MRWVVAWLVACSDPEPGEPGYEDCDGAPSLGDGCEAVDVCCVVTEDYDNDCAYVLADGTTFDCRSELDCTQALQNTICVACPRTEDSPCGPPSP
jgi:hypothetical protein